MKHINNDAKLLLISGLILLAFFAFAFKEYIA